jgi:hypothetical protein
MPVTAAIVGTGAVVASTGASMYSSRQQQKAQERLAMEAQANQAALFGSRPEFEAPEYNPLFRQDAGYADLVKQIIQGNRKNLPFAGALSRGVNRRITRAAKERIGSWDGGFEDALAQMGGNRDMALAGMLPYQDVMQIAGASGRAAGDFGFSGGAGPQTARDLGMQRSQLMFQQGPQLAAQITDIIGAVDPIQRHSTPQEFLLPTQFGVQSAINENQFGATFAFQNAMQTAGFNALPDPQARGLFDIRAMQAGMQGMGAQQLAQGLGGLSSLAMLYGGMAGRPTAGAGAGAANVNLNRAPSNFTGYTAGSGNPVSMRPTGI